MRLTTLLSTAALCAAPVLVTAGGLSDEIMEAPVVAVEPEAAPAGTSISPTFVILGVLAALLIAAALSEEDDDDEEEDEEPASDAV
ncbi:MAG: hypothetical protein AAFQ09_05070 [Pseudomonadota bacterium]